ncbi:N-acetylneuraminate 9-O-acetyltransferase [Taenia crassiceps]|uniref:N-acetylneuraminate 9-O-acetyltransferase n=1 Tax=Taenia crassiceps TaxID=6207 RepID=A0ABR4QHU5_9CEST
MRILYEVAKKNSGALESVFSNVTSACLGVLWVASAIAWSTLSAWKIWMKSRNRKLDWRIANLRELFGCLFLMGCIVVCVAICESLSSMLEFRRYFVRGVFRPVKPIFTWIGFSIIACVCIILNSIWTYPVSKPGPMNCDLTNEIKGWMQALILAYHYFGGYGVLSLYILMRIFVSTYVTLSGFGHFLFYWNNFSPKALSECSSPKHLVRTYFALLYRYAQVFLRTNFLNITMCLSLRQPYLLHYFVGLITYCYTVMAITMTSWLALTHIFAMISKSVNERSRIAAFIIALVTSTLFSAMLKTHKSLFNVIFFSKPLGWVLQSVQDEWQARWSLDRYSSQFGLLCGFLFAQYKQRCKSTDGSSKESNSSYLHKMRIVLFFGTSIGVIAIYICFFSIAMDHSTYVKLHPYCCYIPITAIIILRNVTDFGRNRASVFFSWFGAFALELFILQYHLLLARNMRNVFLVFTRNWIINAIIITPCFVTVSYWAHLLTRKICDIILPPHDFSSKPLLKSQEAPNG